MLLHVLVTCSVLWLWFHYLNIPQLFILPLTDIWVLSSLGLLWIKLLWKVLYKSLCGHNMFSFLLSKYLRIELLGDRVEACLTVLETWNMDLKYSIYKEKNKACNCCTISTWSMNVCSVKAALPPPVLPLLLLPIHRHSLVQPCRMICCSVSTWLSLFPVSLPERYLLWLAALVFSFICRSYP